MNANIEEQWRRADNLLDPQRLGIDIKTVNQLIPGQLTGRKLRLIKTLEGTPRKGTLVIAIRGTDDLEDLILDRNFIFQKSSKNIKHFTIYKQLKQEITKILRDILHPNYKQHWDVFATGHSLGGAIANQLIMDGVATGGMTFAAAPTLDSTALKPSYSIINNNDAVIGGMVRFNETEPYYDAVNMESHDGNTVNHGIPFLVEDSMYRKGDPYPRYDPKIFPVAVTTESGSYGADRFTTEPEAASNSTGSGRAPSTSTMAKQSSYVYIKDKKVYHQTTPQDFEEVGLLLDDLTITKADGKPIVHFYVMQTPQQNYYERLIRGYVTRAIERLLVSGKDKNIQKATMFINTMMV